MSEDDKLKEAKERREETPQILHAALRQYRHNNDNSPDLSNPAQGFVVGFDYETVCGIVNTLMEEKAQLQRWKSEAIQVLTEWDEVYEKCAPPPKLGAPKPQRVIHEIGRLKAQLIAQQRIIESPFRMLLWCPECGERHIDTGEYATKPHHTHACQSCGHCWRPCLDNTVGVQFLPGFKNA